MLGHSKIERMLYAEDIAEILQLPIETIENLMKDGHIQNSTNFTNGKQYTYPHYLKQTMNKMENFEKAKRQTAPLSMKAPIYRLSSYVG